MSRGAADVRVVGHANRDSSSTLHRARNRHFAPLVLALPALAMRAGTAAFAQGPGWVGLSTVRSQYFENEDLLFYVPEAYDRFGAALAAGDFNGDGADDLATGVPLDNGLAGFPQDNVGIVVVRYGVPGSGLETGLADVVLRDTEDVAPEDNFGFALAAGDFNGDGFDDLAVGEPGNHVLDYGKVHVFYGSPGGIPVLAGHRFWYPGGALENCRFGSVLAAGDFNADSFDDLAAGMPQCMVWGNQEIFDDVGAVVVIEGNSGGLLPTQTPLNFHLINQDVAGIPDSPETGDQFGFSLAVGNFNGDTQSIGNEVYDFDDLAIGAPGEDGVGAVLIIYGSPWNVLPGGSVFLRESDWGSLPELDDFFGWSLAAADFDGNGADDLAIGAPYEDLGARTDTGLVTVLYGQMFTGFDFGLNEWWSQASIYGSGFARDFDRFGHALSALRFDPHWDAVGEPFGISTLVVGTPGMSTFSGGFTVVRGTTAGWVRVYKVGSLRIGLRRRAEHPGERLLRRRLRDRRLRRQRPRRSGDRSPATRRSRNPRRRRRARPLQLDLRRQFRSSSISATGRAGRRDDALRLPSRALKESPRRAGCAARRGRTASRA